jgi:hypothetical protein
LPHVAGVQLNPVGHALQGRVLAGDLLGVARLIDGAPDVNADGPPAGQTERSRAGQVFETCLSSLSLHG